MLPPIQFTELLSSLLLGSFGLSPRALAFGPPRRGLPGGSLLVVIVQGREPMPCHALPCHAMVLSYRRAIGFLRVGLLYTYVALAKSESSANRQSPP